MQVVGRWVEHRGRYRSDGYGPHVPDHEPSTSALIEHLLWEWAARQGLIDGVGGTEWRRRHRGTRFVTPRWLEAHEQVVESIHGGRRANADLTNALVAAVVGSTTAKGRGTPRR